MMNSIRAWYPGVFVSWYSQSENERSKTFVMGKICKNFNCSVSTLINYSASLKKRVKISRGKAWRFHFRLNESEMAGKPLKTLHYWYRYILTFSRKDDISRKSFSSSGKIHFSLFTSVLHLCKIKLFCRRIWIYSSTYAISKSMSVSDIQGN